jgi:hypothetical protein
VAKLVVSPGAVRRAYREELGPGQRSALMSWLAFTVTFGGLRALTYSIRAGHGPFRNISVGGQHLHHYLWGIGLLSGVGAVAVRGDERHRRHPAVAVSYGSGLALIVDEFALLLDLKDVYWARQGRISVDLGIGGIAGTGCYFAALPVLRRLRRDHQQLAASPGRSTQARDWLRGAMATGRGAIPASTDRDREGPGGLPRGDPLSRAFGEGRRPPGSARGARPGR